MGIKFLQNIDAETNKLEKAGFEDVNSLPTTNLFVGRQVLYNNSVYYYNGENWKLQDFIIYSNEYIPISKDIIIETNYWDEHTTALNVEINIGSFRSYEVINFNFYWAGPYNGIVWSGRVITNAVITSTNQYSNIESIYVFRKFASSDTSTSKTL